MFTTPTPRAASRKTAATLALIAGFALAPAAQAAVVYGLTGTGATLVRFDSSNPGAAVVVGTISGASEIDGMDFRPADGMLYGFSERAQSIFRINTTTAVATLVSAASVGSNSSLLGVDFNPVPDRMRLVNFNSQNLRINVDTGATTVDGLLRYAAGDVNFGTNPIVRDVAYTNSDTNPATGTTLYYIDTNNDVLATTSNPNGGVLNTVGALGVDASTTGFDILTDAGGNNIAFASFSRGFYSVNLSTGAATLIGDIGALGSGIGGVFGLAVDPAAAVVPEPGSMALVAAAGLALLMQGKRRRV